LLLLAVAGSLMCVADVSVNGLAGAWVPRAAMRC
jgi:hypothetical protein